MRFERLKPPVKDIYEPLGLNEDQIYQLLDDIVRDLQAAKNNPRLPDVFYVTQDSQPLSRDIVWKIVYFKIDDSDPNRLKLIKGDLEGGDYLYVLSLVDGSRSIRNALDDRQLNLRPLTQLMTLPPSSSPELIENYPSHLPPMEKSIDYINRKLESLNGL